MRLKEFVTESRDGVMRLLKSELPTWPEYVIKDMVYTGLENEKDMAEKIEHIRQLGAAVSFWKFYSKMPITFDMLSKDTQYQMRVKRCFGAKNPYRVPNDKARNTLADTIVKNKGMENLPPVIMIKQADGLELWEGWHRTMAAFRLQPEGFRINAWIGTP